MPDTGSITVKIVYSVEIIYCGKYLRMIYRNLSATYIAIYVATCAYGGCPLPASGMDGGVPDGNVAARACISTQSCHSHAK